MAALTDVNSENPASKDDHQSKCLDDLTDQELMSLDSDHYKNLMKNHLEHYGYYSGSTNQTYRGSNNNNKGFDEWKQGYDSRLGGQQKLMSQDNDINRNDHQELDGQFFTDGQLPDDFLSKTTQIVFQYQAGRKVPKLREPRNLYALTKEAGPQQATRWPSHVQVICPAIKFLDSPPAAPAPIYVSTGKESTPQVRGNQEGSEGSCDRETNKESNMIYYNDPGRDIYFMRSRVAGCRMTNQTVLLREYPEGNKTLEFESRFESGNLLKVDKITDFDYELTLRPDLYTTKHTQWFFFRVRNMRPGVTYRFTIINLMKPSSLYNHGMKPVFYSEMKAKKNKIGWTRLGSNIKYYRNNLGQNGRNFYSLTWTCEFPYKDDCCYFAHCFPYTYTDLQEYLLNMANDPVRSRYCKQRVLCRTLAGNLVYVLTITSPSRNPEISRSKRAVVVTARVHPGETNASWMMKGLLDYLTGTTADAKLLRDNFIFKIVPMLNPDGVIVGNYRCSLTGRDLNRNYKSVLKDSFPPIWHTKMMIKRLNAERQIVLYCDLHGHSRKNNIFIYGCENKHNPERRLQERIFPLMLSKNCSHMFAFESCKYKVQKSKEGTGRIVVWMMGVMNSYTMEATFGGTSLPGVRKNTHLSAQDLERMGYDFCDTILDYCDPDSSKVEACMREIQDKLRKKIMKRLEMQGRNVDGDVDWEDYMSESDTSGSDSSCDDGLPVHLLAIAPKLQRKKKMRSRKERGKLISHKALIPSGADISKQVNNRPRVPDKSKQIKYNHTTKPKKNREETHAVISTPKSTVLYGDEDNASARKPPKKVKSEFITNKANFFHFAPPRKLRMQQPKVNSDEDKKEDKKLTDKKLALPPKCLKMRSGNSRDLCYSMLENRVPSRDPNPAFRSALSISNRLGEFIRSKSTPAIRKKPAPFLQSKSSTGSYVKLHNSISALNTPASTHHTNYSPQPPSEHLPSPRKPEEKKWCQVRTVFAKHGTPKPPGKSSRLSDSNSIRHHRYAYPSEYTRNNAFLPQVTGPGKALIKHLKRSGAPRLVPMVSPTGKVLSVRLESVAT